MTPDPGQGRHRPAHLSALLLLALITTGRAVAGVSAYLPLNLAPELESRIERVLVLAGVPVMTRPIRVATVVDALSDACPRNKSLCRQVRRDLAPYLAPVGITAMGAEVGAAKHTTLPQPEQHGAPMDASWQAFAEGYGRFGDHLLVNVGAVGFSGRITPTGSMVSVGGERAQLDVGYRDHWSSPFRLGSMLTGTEAPTLPSVTLSNVEPLTRAHVNYEVYVAQLSYSDRIQYNESPTGYTAGHPDLFSFHIDFEPVPGWSLSANRLMQFGGGARPHSFGLFWRAFLNSTKYDNTSATLASDQQFANEEFSVASSLVLPIRMPMSLYIEYAAEDTFHAENYRYGSSAVSAGFFLPRLRPNLQLRYEFSDWQTNWYTHHIYQDGLRNDGNVLGNWAGDWRLPQDGVGAQSHALELIWDRENGQQFDLQYRTVLNGPYTQAYVAANYASYIGQPYTGQHYVRAQDLAVSLSWPWRSLRVGARVDGGRDEFGDTFGRLAAFARYAGPSANSHFNASSDDESSESAESDAQREADAIARRRVDYFVDLGMFSSQVDYEQDAGAVPADKTTHGSFHLGLGVRRAVNRRNDFGTRIEFDNVDGKLLTALRALDYRHRFGPTFATSFFLGAARYEALTPAYGWYGGAGLQWRDLWKYWDVGVDYRIGDHMVRNKTPGESIIIWPNAFYTIRGVSTYISRRF